MCIEFRKLSIVAHIFTLPVCIVGIRTAVAEIPSIPGWRLVWHDEFEGDDVDEEKWELVDLRDSFNNEKQYYKPEQASIVDGKLRIAATNQPLDGKQYRSARLESWQAFGPGRFEASIDLPTTQGMWPAFWLFPNAPSIPWPTGGEIDILENRGSQPFLVSSAYHWQTNPGPCCDLHQFVFEEYSTSVDGEPVNFHEGFHVYAVEWEETQLRFYVDGVLHYTVNENANRPIFETAKNIILNLAVGGNFGGDPDGSTVFPQHMEIEYVRVWERQTGLSGDYNGDGRIDAADYVVWRRTLGENGIGLSADGSGNGSVGPEDFDVWRDAFGDTLSPAAAAIPSFHVPEPTTALPMAVSIMLVYAQRIGRHGLPSCGIKGHRSTAAEKQNSSR